MPIHKMTREDGVFYSKQVGYIDNVDVRMWANALGNYAKTSDRSVIALLDLTEADRLCPTVVKTFPKILQTTELVGITIIVADQMASRNATVLNKLSDMANVRIFNDPDAARQFSIAQLNPTFGLYNMQSVSVFAAAI